MTKTIVGVLLLGGVALSASGSITVHDGTGKTTVYGDDMKTITIDRPGIYDVTGSDPARVEDKRIVVNISSTLILKNINLKNTRDGVSTIEVNDTARVFVEVDGKNIISSGHGAAGILVTENATLHIDRADGASAADAVLYVSCGQNGAAIGAAGPCGSAQRSVTGGTIIVEGATVVAQRSDARADYWCDGLGGAFQADCKRVEIKGGTLDIQTPGSILATDVVINGGSIRLSSPHDSISRSPVNNNGDSLALAKLPLGAAVLSDVDFRVEGQNEVYSTKDVFPIAESNGEKFLYLYLTKGPHRVTASGDKSTIDYMIEWNGSGFTLDGLELESDSFCTVLLPNVEHLTTIVTTNGSVVSAQENAVNSRRWMVEKGAAVQVAFSADEGYDVVGTKSYSIDSLTNNIIFGTTDGYPLPTVRITTYSPVKFTKGVGVEKIEFACDGSDEFIEFPSEGTNLVVGKVIELKVTPETNYRYTGETQFKVPEGGLERTIDATEIWWGDKDRPWAVGKDVFAYTNGIGGLVITGTGAMSDFASAAEVPWAAVADQVTAVTVEDGVTLGKNALAALSNDVLVTTTSSIGSMKGALGGSEPPAPVPPVGAVTSWDALTNAVATAASGAVIAVGADITEAGGELVVPAGKAVTIKLYGKTVSCGRVTVGGALTVGDAEDSVGRIVASNGAKVAKGGLVTLLGGPMRGTFTTLSPGVMLLFR